MFSVLLLVFGLLATSSATRVNINDKVDKLISQLNEISYSKVGYYPYTLDNALTIGKVTIDGQLVVMGVDSLKRKVDTYADVESNGKATVNTALGFHLFELACSNVTIDSESTVGSLRFYDNSVGLNVSAIVGEDGCRVTIEDIGVQNLDRIILHSSVVKFDEMDLTDLVRDELIRRVEDFLHGDIKSFIEGMLSYSCSYWKDDIPTAAEPTQ